VFTPARRLLTPYGQRQPPEFPHRRDAAPRPNVVQWNN
jgi:hypothetical protein